MPDTWESVFNALNNLNNQIHLKLDSSKSVNTGNISKLEQAPSQQERCKIDLHLKHIVSKHIINV